MWKATKRNTEMITLDEELMRVVRDSRSRTGMTDSARLGCVRSYVRRQTKFSREREGSWRLDTLAAERPATATLRAIPVPPLELFDESRFPRGQVGRGGR